MIAAILNSTMLDSDSAILDSDTFLSSIRLTQKHSPSTLNQTNSIWLTWWWLPSWILPSSIQPFCTKLWLKLIQSDSNLFILTQLDDGSHLEFCHLEFGHLGFSHLSFSSQTQSHLPSLVPTICTKNLHSHFPPHHLHKKYFTHSFWLNLMMAAILNSTMLDSDTAFLDSNTFLSSLRFTQKHSPSTLNQTNSIWLTWWWLPSWILPSSIQPFCTKLWLKLIQSDSNLFILTQLDDGSHLEFCHLEFDTAILDSATLVFPLKLNHTCQDWFPPFAQKNLHSHFPPHHLHKKNFTHSFWLNLMMAAILKSAILNLAILDSATLVFPLKLTHTYQDWFPPFAQKKPPLIHSYWTWWWQPSWILPCWIQTLPSWIQTTFLSSLRFTQKHSHSTLSLDSN